MDRSNHSMNYLFFWDIIFLQIYQACSANTKLVSLILMASTFLTRTAGELGSASDFERTPPTLKESLISSIPSRAYLTATMRCFPGDVTMGPCFVSH